MIVARLGSSLRSLTNYVTKRFSSKRARLSGYYEPHLKRKHMLGACEPYYARNPFLPEERCTSKKQISALEYHPLEKIYGEELKEDLLNYDLILFLHRNFVPLQSLRVYKNTITKLDGKLQILNNKVFVYAFGSLEQNDVLRFFFNHTAIVTGRSEKLPAYLRALAKMNQFTLLAGKLDRRILVNKDQLVQMSQVADLDLSRAHLCNVLDLQAVELSRILSETVTSREVPDMRPTSPE